MDTDINNKWGLALVGERKGGGLSFYSSFSFIWVGFLSLFLVNWSTIFFMVLVESQY